jgi:glycosyltransferase involved in cell wall biosynthesis
MTMQPFFYIVIPTKNRSHTLKHCLQGLLMQRYDNYQIVISDNCSQDNTAEVVTNFQSDKIKYYCSPEPLSMASNYEYALSKLDKEGYVIVMGDDDGICPGGLAMLAEIIKKHLPDVLIGKRYTYHWANHPDNCVANTLIEPVSSDNYYWLDSAKMLAMATDWMYIHNFAKEGGITLPSMYTGGCVSMEVIRRIIKRDGRFYNGQLPDYYSSIILTAEVDRYLFIETPYFVTGVSGSSTGASAYWQQKDKNSSFQQYQKEANIPFESPLVFCYSFALFTAEAILKARKYNPKVPMFNWKNLIFKMIDDALFKPQKSQYEDIIEKTVIIAEAVQLGEYAQQLIDKRPYILKQRQRIPEGYNANSQTRCHYTEKIGVENISQACEYTDQLNKNRHPHYLNNPNWFFIKKRVSSLYRRLLSKLDFL